jgi:hypothetical protein
VRKSTCTIKFQNCNFMVLHFPSHKITAPDFLVVFIVVQSVSQLSGEYMSAITLELETTLIMGFTSATLISAPHVTEQV